MNKRLPARNNKVEIVGINTKRKTGTVFSDKPFWYKGHVCVRLKGFRFPFRLKNLKIVQA